MLPVWYCNNSGEEEATQSNNLSQQQQQHITNNVILQQPSGGIINNPLFNSENHLLNKSSYKLSSAPYQPYPQQTSKSSMSSQDNSVRYHPIACLGCRKIHKRCGKFIICLRL